VLDEDFGVSAQGVRLVREVEMYQWVENSKSETTTKMGGGEETVTTYSYAKEWQDRPVNSAEFKKPAGHENPSMDIEGRSFQIPEGQMSAFTLDQPVLDMIGNSEKFAITAAQAADVDAAYQGTASAIFWCRSATSASSASNRARASPATRRSPATSF